MALEFENQWIEIAIYTNEPHSLNKQDLEIIENWHGAVAAIVIYTNSEHSVEN